VAHDGGDGMIMTHRLLPTTIQLMSLLETNHTTTTTTSIPHNISWATPNAEVLPIAKPCQRTDPFQAVEVPIQHNPRIPRCWCCCDVAPLHPIPTYQHVPPPPPLSQWLQCQFDSVLYPPKALTIGNRAEPSATATPGTSSFCNL